MLNSLHKTSNKIVHSRFIVLKPRSEKINYLVMENFCPFVFVVSSILLVGFGTKPSIRKDVVNILNGILLFYTYPQAASNGRGTIICLCPKR